MLCRREIQGFSNVRCSMAVAAPEQFICNASQEPWTKRMVCRCSGILAVQLSVNITFSGLIRPRSGRSFMSASVCRTVPEQGQKKSPGINLLSGPYTRTTFLANAVVDVSSSCSKIQKQDGSQQKNSSLASSRPRLFRLQKSKPSIPTRTCSDMSSRTFRRPKISEPHPI